MDFKIIKHTGSKNKCDVGNIFHFEAADHTVVKISKKFVYFSDVLYFPKNLFFRWVRLTLRYKRLSYQKRIEINKQKKEILFSLKPRISLRYVVIVDHESNYHWLFANGSTSHSEIVKAFKSKYEIKENYYNGVFGGFYNFRYSNVLIGDEKPILELFGKSDTYGFNIDKYYMALPELKRIMNHIEIDDSWIQTNYPKT